MAAAQDVSPELLANLGFHNAADLEALRGFVGRPLGIMPRRSTRGAQSKTYPDMEKAGLEAIPTVNNGNCFFAAISDQLYGDDSHTAELRAMTVQHIRNHKEYFIEFIPVKRGGGTREVAKRKNAGGYSVDIDHGPASVDARDLQFNNRLASMAKSGTYVDSHEVWAMAKVLNINIRIFEPTYTRDTDETKGNGKAVAAVAYDPVAEHYSSVRRVGDSRTGPANIEGIYKPRVLESTETETPVQSPGKSILAVSDLLNSDQPARSRSSTPGSISIQRDNEDDDIESSNSAKRVHTGRKMRVPSSRKPSRLSKKVSAAPTPSNQTSRAPSPEAVIIVAVPETVPEPKAASNEEAQPVILPPSPPTSTTLPLEALPSPTLPSPPYTQSRSPSLVVISDDNEEEDDTPLSPRKIAQRRRSSKREERAKTALLSVSTTATGKVKKTSNTKKPKSKKSLDDIATASTSSTGESTKTQPETRRGLKRGTRGRKI